MLVKGATIAKGGGRAACGRTEIVRVFSFDRASKVFEGGPGPGRVNLGKGGEALYIYIQ